MVEAEVDHVEGAVPAHGGRDALAEEPVSTVALQGHLPPRFFMSIMSFVGTFPCNPTVQLATTLYLEQPSQRRQKQKRESRK